MALWAVSSSYIFVTRSDNITFLFRCDSICIREYSPLLIEKTDQNCINFEINKILKYLPNPQIEKPMVFIVEKCMATYLCGALFLPLVDSGSGKREMRTSGDKSFTVINGEHDGGS